MIIHTQQNKLISGKMSIIIKNLNKVYSNGHHALKDINLEIPSGMFGLLGPNGAGKSTLMRILVALMEPTSGEVEMYGCNLLKERREVRRLLGYLPQDFRFFAKYKVIEYLDYAARLSGMDDNRKRKKAVADMLEQVGLYEVRERYASKLSGGMKRRLGIAQALIHEPKVIIVDEPTTGLHAADVHKLIEVLQRLVDAGNTVLVIEHNLDVIKTADHIIDLGPEGGDGGGYVVASGTPEEVAQVAESYTGQYLKNYL